MSRLALAGQNVYIRQHYKKYTVPTDKFVGTANRKPPFAVPTIFVGTVGPTNLSEQPIGNQFSVPTILYIKPPYSRPPPLTHSFSIGTPSNLFRQKFGGTAVLASFGGTAVLASFVGTSAVPTSYVGTSAVPTNLSEQTII